MSDDITIVSTTDSVEDIQAAMTGKPVEKPAEPAPGAAAAATEPPTPAAAAPATDPTTPAKPAEPETAEQKAERERQSARQRRVQRIQSEIDELTAQKHDARRDVEAEQARLAELRAERTRLEAEIGAAKTGGKPAAAAAPAAPGGQPPAADATPKPKLDDVDGEGKPKFANYEEWVEAVSAWHSAEAERKAQAAVNAALEREKLAARSRIETAQQTRETEEAAQKYEEKSAAFRQSTPNFDAVLESAKDVIADLAETYGNAVLNVVDRFTVFDANNGPAINHYLASHPDEMRRIVALPVPLQLAELGRLDARLEPASKTTPAQVPAVPVSRAPEPVTPVSSAPTGSTVSPEDEDYRTYANRRNREERIAKGLPV